MTSLNPCCDIAHQTYSTGNGEPLSETKVILFCGDLADSSVGNHSPFFDALNRLYRALSVGLNIPLKNFEVLYSRGAKPSGTTASMPVDYPGTKSGLLQLLHQHKEQKTTSLLLYICGHGSAESDDRFGGSICASSRNAANESKKGDEPAFTFELACKHYDGKGNLISPPHFADLQETPSPDSSATFEPDLVTPADLAEPLKDLSRSEGDILNGYGVHLVVHSCFSGLFAPLFRQCNLASFASSTDAGKPMNTCAVASDLHLYHAPTGWPFHLAREWSLIKNPTLANMRLAMFRAVNAIRNCDSVNPIFLPRSL